LPADLRWTRRPAALSADHLWRVPRVVAQYQLRREPEARQRFAGRTSQIGLTRRRKMAKIPKALQEHINTAFPANVCLLGSVLPNGFAQITPRGGTMVYDDQHIALWERGKGSTSAALQDGTRLTIYFRKPQLREEGLLPKGG